VFRRIDRDGDTFYIGRIAVSDEESEPVVVDWRAQVAEPFYRATGRDPMGLERRRHSRRRARALRGSTTSCSATRPTIWTVAASWARGRSSRR
jgi:DNA helicase IV